VVIKHVHTLSILLFSFWSGIRANDSIQTKDFVNLFNQLPKSEIDIEIHEEASFSPSYYFNGEGANIELYCKQTLERTLSFCAWIRPENLQEKNMTIAGIPGVFLFRTTTSRDLQLTEPDVANINTEGVLLSSRNWSFVCCVIDFPEVKMYCNGKLIKVVQLKNQYKQRESSLIIGKDNWQHEFHGCMHHISVYSEVLSEEEISDRYEAGLKKQLVSSGLIFYYPFENDKSYHSTWETEIKTHNVVFQTDSIRGSVGYFNGKDGFIDFGIVPLDNVITISAWIKPYALSLEKGAIVSLGHAFAFRVADGGNLLFTIPQMEDLQASSVSLKKNTWQQIGITFKEGEGAIFYLNGEQVGAVQSEVYQNAQKDLRIGNNLWNNFFYGKMDDLIIWDRILTAEEMSKVHSKNEKFWNSKLIPQKPQQLHWLIIPIVILLIVAVFVFIKVKNKKHESESETKQAANPFLEKAIEIVNTNLSDSNFSVEQFANAMHMSKTKLYNDLKNKAGQSPKEFVREQRLLKVAQLLKESERHITEIFYETGFESRAYFNKCFKEKFGTTPSAFRSKQL